MLFSFEKHAHFEHNDLRHQNHLFFLLFWRGGGGETCDARELKAVFVCEECHISPDKISNLRRINTTRTMTSSFAKSKRVLLLLLVYSAFIFSASSSSSSSSPVRLSTATSREGMFGKTFKWETCDDAKKDDDIEDKEGKDIDLTSVALNPDPVRTGGTAKFILRGNVMADSIPTTSVIDVQILYQGVPLYTDTLSLCETIRADETDPSQPTKCPIERKTNDDDANATTVVTMEYDAAVPELAPSGEFEARLVGKRTEAATRGEVFCVKATLRVKGPF